MMDEDNSYEIRNQTTGSERRRKRGDVIGYSSLIGFYRQVDPPSDYYIRMVFTDPGQITTLIN